MLRARCERRGIPVEVRSIDRSELYVADEMFLCGTGRPDLAGHRDRPPPDRLRRGRPDREACPRALLRRGPGPAAGIRTLADADHRGCLSRPRPKLPARPASSPAHTASRCRSPGATIELDELTLPKAPVAPLAPPFPPTSPEDRPVDSSTARPVVEHPGGERARLVQRSLEMVPGLVTWALILSPLILSLRVPEVVAWAVLSFDFYWFYKALMLTGSVSVAFLRIRGVIAVDWRSRAFALADLPARRTELEVLVWPSARASGSSMQPGAQAGRKRRPSRSVATARGAQGHRAAAGPSVGEPIPIRTGCGTWPSSRRTRRRSRSCTRPSAPWPKPTTRASGRWRRSSPARQISTAARTSPGCGSYSATDSSISSISSTRSSRGS